MGGDEVFECRRHCGNLLQPPEHGRRRASSVAETRPQPHSLQAKALTAKFTRLRLDIQEELSPTGLTVLKNRFRTLSQVQEDQRLGIAPPPPPVERKLTVVTRPRAMTCDEYLSTCSSPSNESKWKSGSPGRASGAPPAYMSANLHQLCMSAFPSLELVRLTLSISAFAVRERDNNGNLPLHVSVNRDDPVTLVVRELLKVYPAGAKIRDSQGNLSLFLACRRPKVTAGVIKALLQVYPEAARVKCFGNLALHHLVHTGSASPECIRLLLEVFPDAAGVANKQANLPLHYLCAQSNPHLESVRILMNAYPSGVTALNDAGETPIMRALSVLRGAGGGHSNRAGRRNNDPECIPKDDEDAERIHQRECRERVRLLLLTSSSAALNNEQRQLLRDLNWEARRPAMLICSAILRDWRIRMAAARVGLDQQKKHGDSKEVSVVSRRATFEHTICGYEDVWRLILQFL